MNTTTLFPVAALLGLVARLGAQTPAVAQVDTTNPRQVVQGFGGALAFYGNWLTAHPNKQDIYKALFDPVDGLGISWLRLQNNFRYQTDPAFDTDAAEFVKQANAARSGKPISILMSSWTPPASLKSNGAEGCPNTKNCTLAKVDGAYSYTGFANYWTDSIQAYRKLGVDPAYVSIQNEPDWIADYGSCQFNPTESVTNGVAYAGYDKALDAVYRGLQGLDKPPKLAGPETLGIGYNAVQRYMSALNPDQVDVLAHHLYHGGSETSPDTFDAVFDTLNKTYVGKPRFQTEFSRGSAFDTAWIIQNALTVEEATVYLYWGLAWPSATELVYLDFPWDKSKWTQDSGWKKNDSYYAMKHFSLYVQPGFQRYAMRVDHPALRVSAFLSPDLNRLVAVFVNTSTTETVAPALVADDYTTSTAQIFRSNFAGQDERFALVGGLDETGALSLPPQSVATVVIDRTVAGTRALRGFGK